MKLGDIKRIEGIEYTLIGISYQLKQIIYRAIGTGERLRIGFEGAIK
jgi:hypothetical protein